MGMSAELKKLQRLVEQSSHTLNEAISLERDEGFRKDPTFISHPEVWDNETSAIAADTDWDDRRRLELAKRLTRQFTKGN